MKACGGEEGYLHHSHPRYWMEVSGLFHALVSLSPVLIGQETERSPEPVWELWRREKSLPMPGIELQFLGHLALS
jgi:hypothetical protein